MSNLERAYAPDISIRIADEHYPPEGIKITARDFDKEGVVYEKRWCPRNCVPSEPSLRR
jgi:ribonuclease Z